MKQATSKVLFDYWNAIRRDRLAPRRFDIEPSQIAAQLPDTFILERTEAFKFRFRLAGTRICENFGHDLRGCEFGDLWSSDDQTSIDAMLVGPLQQGAVGVVEFGAETFAKQCVDWEMVLLPMVQTGPGVDRLLGGLTPIDRPGWLNTHTLVRQTITRVSQIWPDGRPHAELRQSPKNEDRQSPFRPDQTFSRIVTSERRSFRVYEGGLSKD